MTVATISLKELHVSSLEELLNRVIREQLQLKIRLPNGEIVSVQPEPKLEPLPILEGSVPNDWKDAIYG